MRTKELPNDVYDYDLNPEGFNDFQLRFMRHIDELKALIKEYKSEKSDDDLEVSIIMSFSLLCADSTINNNLLCFGNNKVLMSTLQAIAKNEQLLNALILSQSIL